jgi:hypothetical protein
MSVAASQALHRNLGCEKTRLIDTESSLSDDSSCEWTGHSADSVSAWVNGRTWPRVCQNTKVAGFEGSLYPSRRATKPL